MRRSGQIWEASAASPPGEWRIDGGDDDADGEGAGGASYADEVGDGEGDGGDDDADGVGDGGAGDPDEFGRHQLLLLLVNGGLVNVIDSVSCQLQSQTF